MAVIEGLFNASAGGFRRNRSRQQRQRQHGGMMSASGGAPAPSPAPAHIPDIGPGSDPIVELRTCATVVYNNAVGGLGRMYAGLGAAIRSGSRYFITRTSSFLNMRNSAIYLLSINTVLFGSRLYGIIQPVFMHIFTTPFLLDILMKIFSNSAEGLAAVGMVGAVGLAGVSITGLVLLAGWFLRRATTFVLTRSVINPATIIRSIAAEDGVPATLRAEVEAALGAARNTVVAAMEERARAAAVAAAEAAVAAAEAAAAAALRTVTPEAELVVTVSINAGEDILRSGTGYGISMTVSGLQDFFSTNRAQFTQAAFATFPARIAAAIAAARDAPARAAADIDAELRAAPLPALEDGAAAAAVASPEFGGGGGGAGSGGSGSSASAAPSSSAYAGGAAAASPPFGAVASPHAVGAASLGGSTGGSVGGYRRKSKKRQNKGRRQNNKKSRRSRFRF